jgi:hypothetical protein
MQPELTYAEGMTLECAREWRRAETDAELFAELQAWYAMRLYVDNYRLGNYDREEARQCVGEERADAFYDAVRTVAELLPMFGDNVSPMTEGGADNGR